MNPKAAARSAGLICPPALAHVGPGIARGGSAATAITTASSNETVEAGG